MSILVDKNTRLLVQGITGNEGIFHSEQMLAYGTNIVAGVTPGKGGEWVLNGKVPVFDSVDNLRPCFSVIIGFKHIGLSIINLITIGGNI